MIENMVAQRRQWPRCQPVEIFQQRQQMWVARDPGFGGAGWNEDADAAPLRQGEPGLHRLAKYRAAMIGDSEMPVAHARRHGAAMETAQRLMRPAAQAFHQNLAG